MDKMLIFDFFGVICSEVSVLWLNKYFNEEEICKIQSGLFIEVDTSKITTDKLFEELGKMINKDALEVRDEWYDLVSINNEVIGCIKQLKNKYKIVLLSNAMSDFLRDILKRNSIENLFDRIIVSSEVKMVKPNKEIYLEALKDFNGKALMFDDNKINLDTASSLGIDVFLVENNEEFISKLNSLNM